MRIPIEDADEQRRRGGRVALRYDRLPPLRGLTTGEQVALQNMRLIYQQMCNLPWLPQVQQLMEQLNMSDSDTAVNQQLLRLDASTIALDGKGSRHLGDLFDAAMQGYTVDITYRRFEGETRVHEGVSVQLLKQDDRFWYVAAVNEHSIHRERPFFWLAVDRVLRVRPSKQPWLKVEVDWDAYFADIVGITNRDDEPVQEVRFLVYDEMRHYVEAAPLHRSQRTMVRHDLEGEPLQVTLRVKVNHELRARLTSMTKDIAILQPQALADWHQAMLQRALERQQTITQK